MATATGCSPDTVDLRWDGGAARFSVEIADDAAERARGLMFREELGKGQGMLFVYDSPHRVSFWMKNTPLPLDLVFVGPGGVVEKVHAMAVPFDETLIPGGDDITHVLEINGGLAAKLGIVPGAVMRHPSLPQAGAAWPCAAP